MPCFSWFLFLFLPYLQNALLSKNRQCVPVIHPREHPMTHLNALTFAIDFSPTATIISTISISSFSMLLSGSLAFNLSIVQMSSKEQKATGSHVIEQMLRHWEKYVSLTIHRKTIQMASSGQDRLSSFTTRTWNFTAADYNPNCSNTFRITSLYIVLYVMELGDKRMHETKKEKWC